MRPLLWTTGAPQRPVDPTVRPGWLSPSRWTLPPRWGCWWRRSRTWWLSPGCGVHRTPAIRHRRFRILHNEEKSRHMLNKCTTTSMFKEKLLKKLKNFPKKDQKNFVLEKQERNPLKYCKNYFQINLRPIRKDLRFEKKFTNNEISRFGKIIQSWKFFTAITVDRYLKQFKCTVFVVINAPGA